MSENRTYGRILMNDPSWLFVMHPDDLTKFADNMPPGSTITPEKNLWGEPSQSQYEITTRLDGSAGGERKDYVCAWEFIEIGRPLMLPLPEPFDWEKLPEIKVEPLDMSEWSRYRYSAWSFMSSTPPDDVKGSERHEQSR